VHCSAHVYVFSVPRRAASSDFTWPTSDDDREMADSGEDDNDSILPDDGNNNDDRSPSPGTGDKRPHSPVGGEHTWRQPVKVHTTIGAKPKAGDYEVAVQNILTVAIGFYRGYLSGEDPYPGSITEMRWAKKAWRDGCDECGARIHHNGEIIKLVRPEPFAIPLMVILFLDHQSRLTSSWPSQD
jgi:hypothetical protein